MTKTKMVAVAEEELDALERAAAKRLWYLAKSEKARLEALAELRAERASRLEVAAVLEDECAITHAGMLVALEMARYFQPSALFREAFARTLKERDKALAEAAMWKEEALRAGRIMNDLPSPAEARAALEESLSALAPAWADITRPLRALLPKPWPAHPAGATSHTDSDGSGGPAGR